MKRFIEGVGRDQSTFVEEQGGKLKLFSLPPNSPTLMPNELVCNVVKGAVSKRVILDNREPCGGWFMV